MSEVVVSGGFAIPAPTTSRLLAVWFSVLAAAVFAGHWALGLRLDVADRAESRCAAEQGSADYLACVDAARPVEAAMILAGPAALVLVAAVLYALRPAIIRRWNRLGPEPGDRPVAARVAERCAAVGVRRPPRVEIALRNVRPFVYGRPPYRIAVPARMLSGAASMSSHDKALLAHEIAHVRAGDGLRYDLTMSAWYASLIIVVVPLAADAATVTGVGGALLWRLLAVTALLLLTVRSVVRAREHEADVRAAVEDPGASPLGWVGAAPSRPRAAVPRWLAFHPDRFRRDEVLREPELLLRPSVTDAAVAGAGTGLLGTEAALLAGLLLPARPWEAYLLAALFVAGPPVTVLFLGACRAAIAGRWLALVPAHGPAFGAGLLFGTQLAPRAAADWWRAFPAAGGRASQLGLAAARPGAVLLVVVGALGIGTLVALWCAAAARLTTRGRPPSARRLLPVLAVGIVLFGVPLAAWLLGLRLAAGGRWPASLVAYTMTLPPRRTALLLALGAAMACLVAQAATGLPRWGPAGGPRPLSTGTPPRAGTATPTTTETSADTPPPAGTPPRAGTASATSAVLLACAALFACAATAGVVLVTPGRSRDGADRYLATEVPRWTGVPFPRTGNSFYACYWVSQVDATGWPAADDAVGLAAVGRFLSTVDDPVLAEAGEQMARAASGNRPALAAGAARAVFVRCDAIISKAARPLPVRT